MEHKTIQVNFDFNLERLETFGEFSRWWFVNYHGLEESTRASYKYTLGKLNETFSDFKMAEIKAYHIDAYLRAAHEAGLSHSYIVKLRSMLHQIMRRAEANGIIDKNPVPLADPLHLTVGEHRSPLDTKKDAFKIEEVQTLFDKLPTDKIGDSIRLLLCSGLRAQELLALQPEHIVQCESGRILQVRQAVKLVNGTACIGSPKTVGSYRDVYLPEIASPICDRLLRQAGVYLVPGKVDGLPYNPGSYRKIYKAYISRCGVRVLPPHCCRYTYISQMQAAGITGTVIKGLVGHTKERMTAHYTKVQQELWLEAVEALEERYINLPAESEK